MIGLILAAGYATRLYPLTINKAKALLPIQGRPIIDHILDEMLKMPDLTKVVVVTNHRFAADFEAWSQTRTDIDVVILDDQTTDDSNKLGAIGDIQFVIDELQIEDDLFVIAGDNLFTFDLKTAWSKFREKGRDLILAKELDPQTEDLTRFAIAEVNDAGDLISLEEKPTKPRSNLAVFATYFYQKDTLPLIRTYLAEGHSPDAPGHFPAWLYKHKPVYLYLFEGDCVDIGTPEAYQMVNEAWPFKKLP